MNKDLRFYLIAALPKDADIKHYESIFILYLNLQESELDEIKDDNAVLEDQISELEDEIDELKDEIKELEKQVKWYENN